MTEVVVSTGILGSSILHLSRVNHFKTNGQGPHIAACTTDDERVGHNRTTPPPPRSTGLNPRRYSVPFFVFGDGSTICVLNYSLSSKGRTRRTIILAYCVVYATAST